MLFLFDHEEIGSQSAQGAKSNMVTEISRRVFLNFCPEASEDNYFQSLRKSMFLSVDGNHAVHPNYPEKSQMQHQARVNSGVLVPFSSQQYFMSDCSAYSMMKEIAVRTEVPIQEFLNRNDIRGGSTIGPKIASKCGVKTLDLGMPILAMHSAREMAGVIDLLYLKKILIAFMESFGTLKQDLLSA